MLFWYSLRARIVISTASNEFNVIYYSRYVGDLRKMLLAKLNMLQLNLSLTMLILL